MPKPLLAITALLVLLAAPWTAAALRAQGWAGSSVTAQQVVIQVPRMTVTRTTVITRTPPRAPPMLVERKADDCVKIDRIVGFMVDQRDSIELLLTDGSRLRARLGSDCPALDFYTGAYVKPNKDGRMCVKRDALRSRSGASCVVEVFRKLVPTR